MQLPEKCKKHNLAPMAMALNGRYEEMVLAAAQLAEMSPMAENAATQGLRFTICINQLLG